MVLILDGKKLATQLANEICSYTKNLQIKPKLAIILVGENAASEIYVKNKTIYASNINIESQVIRLSARSNKEEILNKIKSLNEDKNINGIIVQSPLPNQDFQDEIFESIAPEKDVDGFTIKNIGRMYNGNKDCFISCTPLGILKLLTYYNVSLSGKHVVIIGRSKIVGRPLSILLSQNFENCNATVTLCHSKTKNLKNITQSADILISATGIPNFINKEMIQDGVVIVDVGINRVSDLQRQKGYRICGDVNFDDVYPHCRAISPVPGGVGPMTIAMLMQNTLKAYIKQKGL